MTIAEEIRKDRESGAKRLEREYKAGLMAFAKAYCADESDAESYVYLTFEEVLDHIDRYTEKSAFFAWMCKIFLNSLSNDIRRKSNQRIVGMADLPEAPDAGDERIYLAVDSKFLHEAIDALPPQLREAIFLRYFMDMPMLQMARFLTIPVGTVKSRLRYARLALAKRLGAAAKKQAVAIAAAAAVLVVGAAVTLAVAPSAAPEEPPAEAAPEERESDLEQKGEKEMNIRQTLTAAAAAVAATAGALDYPVYTVTAGGAGTTQLSGADVEIVAEAGAAPQTVAFSTLSPATGTFRKRGTGELASDAGLSGFTGEIRVEEGSFVVTGPGQLGANDADSAANRANVVVSNEASVVFRIAEGTGDRFRQAFNLTGDGYQGQGAIRIESVGMRYDIIGAGTISADTNATICVKHGVGVQFAYETFDLNWWTLTIKAFDKESSAWSYLDMNGIKIDDPGTIVVDGLDWRTWNGISSTARDADPAKVRNMPTTLALENGAYMNPNGFAAQYTLSGGATVPWILDAGDCSIGLGANTDWGKTNTLAWAGPVRLSGQAKIKGSNNGAQSFTFPYGLCGDGSLEIDTTNTQINLVSPKSDFYGVIAGSDAEGWRTEYVHSNFYGGVSLAAGGELRVFWPRALEGSAAGATLDASDMTLAYGETYDLPPLAFDVPAGETKAFSGGTNGVVRSLVKTGDGTLDMTAPMTVTGVTEIAGGTLRIPCDRAGLNFGWYVVPVGEYGSDHVHYLDNVYTNCVELGAELAYTGDLERWKRSAWEPMVFMYGGWIWNRSGANQDWTIVSQLMRGALVYIDGQSLAGTPYGWDNCNYWEPSSSGNVAYRTVKDVAPGPHRIDIRIYTGTDMYSTIANAWNGGLSSLKGVKNWTDPLFGLGIDRQGRGPDGDGNIDFENLEKLVDPGDGSLLTVTTNSLDGVLAHTPQFKRLKFSGGTLDARGGSLAVDDLEIANDASATIANSNTYCDGGTVTLDGTLRSTCGNVAEGRILNVEGRLVFGAGSTVRIDGIKGNLSHGKYVIATATGGIDGKPTFVDDDSVMAAGWGTRLVPVEGAPEKKRLELVWRMGMALFFK